ncbi:hypothetical protein OZX57_04430 [Bifidobacterium sp. ESL0682]|uniref:hypothetical protein n=1 Tax=Bifidobacterium sp. ESL0682 TaxID=2983212 RepID=UPI0023F7BFA3|nr:hypothetical protein [Bifidobacterium sp. ESL0682]WEV42651.1 hypothetical protein OZX57_04430 [Bifidobacterium sp. ESL0682]
MGKSRTKKAYGELRRQLDNDHQKIVELERRLNDMDDDGHSPTPAGSHGLGWDGIVTLTLLIMEVVAMAGIIIYQLDSGTQVLQILRVLLAFFVFGGNLIVVLAMFFGSATIKDNASRIYSTITLVNSALVILLLLH